MVTRDQVGAVIAHRFELTDDYDARTRPWFIGARNWRRVGHDPALALRAADLRRAVDYRGMARGLALAAQFTPDSSRTADVYLRAGRSAAARQEPVQARMLLAQARRLAPDAVLQREAGRAIQELK